MLVWRERRDMMIPHNRGRWWVGGGLCDVGTTVVSIGGGGYIFFVEDISFFVALQEERPVYVRVEVVRLRSRQQLIIAKKMVQSSAGSSRDFPFLPFLFRCTSSSRSSDSSIQPHPSNIVSNQDVRVAHSPAFPSTPDPCRPHHPTTPLSAPPDDPHIKHVVRALLPPRPTASSPPP